MKQSLLWTVATLAVLAPACVLAQQPHGVYVAADVGRTEVELDGTTSPDELGWSVGAGWQLLPYVGIEASYINSRTMTLATGALRYDIEAKAVAGSVVGVLPFAERWSVFARAGAMRWEYQESLTLAAAPLGKARTRDTDLVLGAGVGLMVEGAKLRLEYQRADTGDYEFSFISLGVQWFVWKH